MISWRRVRVVEKWLTESDMRIAAKKLGKSGYGDYLLSLLGSN